MWHLRTQLSNAHGSPGVMGGPNDLRGLFKDDSTIIHAQVPQ